MSIQFNCRTCGKLLKAGKQHAGKRAKCSGCGAALVVPSVSADAPLRIATLTRAVSQAAPPRWADEALEEEPPLLPPRQQAEEEGVDMTAMVDVTFFLLIFFMTTSLQSLAAGLQMPTPDAANKSAAGAKRTIQQIEQDDDYVVVRIDKDNTVWVDDAAAPSEQDLLSKLRAARHGAGGTQGANRMMVLPSGDARHATVVMVLDAGVSAGMEDVRLGSSDEDL